MKCPCNPIRNYSECCEKAHKNISAVTSAEQLMRSRYSAFVLANIDYLQKSHHSSTRPSKREKRDIEKWTKSLTWLRLEILNSSKVNELDSEGVVEFKAFFMENGSMNVIHENSMFCKENNHWVYVNAAD